MDHQPYAPTNQPVTASTSAMPTAALTLSIIGLVFSFAPFFGTICPSIAITLALLSRGGNMQTEGKSKVALIFGVIGLLIALAMIVYSIYYFAVVADYNTIYNELENTFMDSNYSL